MRLQNLSPVHRTADLLPLIDFVTTFYKYPYLAKLVVSQRPSTIFGTGRAYATNPNLTETDMGSPSLVQVNLASGSYPKKSMLILELGVVTVNSWEEEFVLILAHELRHIDQIYTGSHAADEVDAAEYDAESCAIALLSVFRNQLQQAA